MANYAVLVGVSEYYDTQIRSLPHARAAIRKLREALVTDGGFSASHIDVLITEKKKQDPLTRPFKYSIVSTLLNVYKKWKLKEDDFFLFYFIGHGYGSVKGDQMLTMDTCFQYIQDTALSTEVLTKLIFPIPPARKLIVFDACRNEVKGTLGVQEGIGKTRIEEFLTLYACQPGELAYIPRTGTRLPLLTQAFVQAVKDKECHSIREMYDLICDRVQAASYKIGARQTPDISTGGKNLEEIGFLARRPSRPKRTVVAGFEEIVTRANEKLHYLYEEKYPRRAPSYAPFVRVASPLKFWREQLDQRAFRRIAFDLLEKGGNADLYTVCYMLRWGADNTLFQPLIEIMGHKKYRGTVTWQALDALEVMLRSEQMINRLWADALLKTELTKILEKAAKEHPTREGRPFLPGVVWGKILQICRRAGVPEKDVFAPSALKNLV